ncbi:hypothetical protein EVAR_32254_1 [Eumeta japonica]|uniref:Uncharacterized protein n=1 Tax=Eumeta variegata TaxID=151549 RepID=A0A4C1X203_EUMVA|nr:hypothetical protein EVAR_32254_1 [Eumeta japonica]
MESSSNVSFCSPITRRRCVLANSTAVSNNAPQCGHEGGSNIQASRTPPSLEVIPGQSNTVAVTEVGIVEISMISKREIKPAASPELAELEPHLAVSLNPFPCLKSSKANLVQSVNSKIGESLHPLFPEPSHAQIWNHPKSPTIPRMLP